MCVLAFAWDVDERWPLVLIGNRDERHARATVPLGRWPEGGVIAGRDLESGGTWLGVSEAGRLGVVTNVATGRLPSGLSRGRLVTDFLEGRISLDGAESFEQFNPFNLLAFDGRDLGFLSNQPHTSCRRLEPGLYVLANGGLNERLFRTDALRAGLIDWFARDGERFEPLLELLANENTSGDVGEGAAESNDKAGARTVPIFIRNPVYGTRSSTVVAVTASGSGIVIERRFEADGSQSGEICIGFRWPRTIRS